MFRNHLNQTKQKGTVYGRKNDCEWKSIQNPKAIGKGKRRLFLSASDGAAQYVLKQIHHEPCSYYQFGNKMEAELRDYKRLQTIGIRMPLLFDADMEQERIIKEYIEGDTIYDLVCQDKMEAAYLEQVKDMCARLYAAHTNIDYFPTNFVVQNGILYRF